MHTRQCKGEIEELSSYPDQHLNKKDLYIMDFIPVQPYTVALYNTTCRVFLVLARLKFQGKHSSIYQHFGIAGLFINNLLP